MSSSSAAAETAASAAAWSSPRLIGTPAQGTPRRPVRQPSRRASKGGLAPRPPDRRRSVRIQARQSEVAEMPGRLSAKQLELIDAYWRAANYLSVSQIYLLDNPLLREPLKPEHVKPRLLGHWGTTPGLNFLYAHLNRAIRERDLNAFFICGPGHGGPAVVANTYLEGSY